jgi:hypothetical protein
MAIQRNVQQQAAETRANIELAVSVGVAMPQWLRSLLQERTLSPDGGLLVRYCEVPEQEGNLQSGVWLTDELEFWEFAVMVSRSTQQTLVVEQFTNATPLFPVVPALPGTGPSFGHLARQVLHSKRDA